MFVLYGIVQIFALNYQYIYIAFIHFTCTGPLCKMLSRSPLLRSASCFFKNTLNYLNYGVFYAGYPPCVVQMTGDRKKGRGYIQARKQKQTISGYGYLSKVEIISVLFYFLFLTKVFTILFLTKVFTYFLFLTMSTCTQLVH